MDTCYLLVDVQELRIQSYFCIKQDDYFFSLFLGHPVVVLVQNRKVEQFKYLCYRRRMNFLGYFCISQHYKDVSVLSGNCKWLVPITELYLSEYDFKSNFLFRDILSPTQFITFYKYCF